MKQKTILITGATGFLGSFITQELFEAGFCLKLLVRKTHDLQAKERVSDVFPLCDPSLFADRTRVGRIEIIEGDVSKKYLGLDTREYIRLAEAIDEVFHCAAATKFNDVHNTLTLTNVSGTENVVQFSYTEKIPIKFIFWEKDFTTKKIKKQKGPTKMTSQLARNAYINLRI